MSMFIDPKLAQDRLNDPTNILNSLFSNKTRSTPEIKPDPDPDPDPEIEIEQDSNNTVEENDSALLAMLGLNPRRELPTTSAVLPYNRHGRAKTVTEMPPETQELIGTLANLGSQTEVSRTFNVSQGAVSEIAHGKRKKNPELRDKINTNIGKVVDRALEKLLCTVDSMDEHRIEQLSIKDAANVAAQMSKVVSNMNPKADTNNFSGAQLIVYAPAQFNESRYEVVELGQ